MKWNRLSRPILAWLCFAFQRPPILLTLPSRLLKKASKSLEHEAPMSLEKKRKKKKNKIWKWLRNYLSVQQHLSERWMETYDEWTMSERVSQAMDLWLLIDTKSVVWLPLTDWPLVIACGILATWLEKSDWGGIEREIYILKMAGSLQTNKGDEEIQMRLWAHCHRIGHGSFEF